MVIWDRLKSVKKEEVAEKAKDAVVAVATVGGEVVTAVAKDVDYCYPNTTKLLRRGFVSVVRTVSEGLSGLAERCDDKEDGHGGSNQ